MMMASYIVYSVCAVLFAVHPVHSYTITGIIQHDNDAVSEVRVSNYVDGDNWGSTWDLTLDRLEGAETLSTLTIANFKSIYRLNLTNIALQHVPVFVNTTITRMVIMGNEIKSIPANAFSGPQPKRLYLTHSKIETMADRSVNINARFLSLKCNKISNFSQSWFEDPGSIQSLDLSGNRIVHIPDRAFNQMTRLTAVYLDRNQITSIGSGAFTAGIGTLSLDFNDIVQVTPDMFADRDKPMLVLYLHHNKLSYLSEALVLKLKPGHITLIGNPWQCQCLRDLERWLRNLNSTRWDIPARRDEPVCVVPVNFQNSCIPVVDKELQQTYAMALLPVQGGLSSGCNPYTEDLHLAELT